MKNLVLVTAVSFSIFTSAYAATAAQFSDVDENSDGMLNIGEAKAALPELAIVDENNDGIVSKSEAEKSVPGLTLTPNGQGDGSVPVGEREYRMIVQAIEEQTGQRVSSSN